MIAHFPSSLVRLAICSVFALSGCNDFTSQQNKNVGPGLLAENLGCIQGVIIDGLAKEGVDLMNLAYDAGSGVRAMVGGTAVSATPAANFLGNSKRTSGEYSICNIPLDERYNLVVDLPGFQRVEGLFLIESTLSSRSAEPSKNEITKRVPTEIINVIVYPVGVQTGDLMFSVTHEGKPLSGARVQLLSTGKNKLDSANNFALVYSNIKNIPLASDTEKDGQVVFKAENLVLGATYEYRVFPPTGSNSRGFTTGEFTLGLVDNDRKGQPYVVQVELNEIAPEIRLHSRNALMAANGNAELELIFNRPVAVLFDTEDDVTAEVSDGKKAELLKNVPGNAKSEQVTVTIVGNRVVLKANFSVAPDAKLEPAVKAAFSGLSLRATDDEGTLAKWTMPAPMLIDIFGGVNQKPVPTSLTVETLISSAVQTGPADMELQQPLAVKVLNQLGEPIGSGVNVTFKLDNSYDHGVLRSASGSSNDQVEAVTDANGVAQVNWRLPTKAGSYTAQALIGDLAPLTFTAEATDWVKSIVTSSIPATAPAATELPAVTVQLYNQAGERWTRESKISLRTGSGSGKIRDIATSIDYAQQALDTTTDSEGKIALVWSLGTTTGNQQLTISIPGSAVYKVFSVAATSRFDRLVVKNQVANIAVNADGLFSIQILDQAGVPMNLSAGIFKVRFLLDVGTGTLRGINDASGTTSRVFDVTPTVDGLAEIKFRPTEVGTGQFKISTTLTWGAFTHSVSSVGTISAGE